MQFVEKYRILYPIRVSYLRGRKAFPDNMWILSQGKNNVFFDKLINIYPELDQLTEQDKFIWLQSISCMAWPIYPHCIQGTK